MLSRKKFSSDLAEISYLSISEKQYFVKINLGELKKYYRNGSHNEKIPKIDVSEIPNIRIFA